MDNMVRTERDGSVLVVVIDNPPINAGSLGVRRGLMEAIETLGNDSTLVAAVFMGAGSTFIAGSDLREFGKPLEDPQLPAVIAAIEACAKPVVAAIHGAALGGGFELCLGCDARVAAAGSRLGLPEVTLGMIPGAGGTQRLPRLVGVARAIELVCSGERLTAERALDLGIVDAVVPSDLRRAAVQFAIGLEGRKRRLRDEPVPASDEASVERASSAALRAGKRRPQVSAAIEAVKLSATMSVDKALVHERSVFQQLRLSKDAFALRHQFFAERDAAKRPELAGVAPRPVEQVVVIGAGTMGSGIAISALDAGFKVALLEQDAAALERGRQRIADHYAGRVAAGKLKAMDAARREAQLVATTDWETLRQADLVIEAVFEDLRVKQEVFRRVDALARPGALLASNTSYLDLDAIASSTSRPQDVLGLHFFSPANVMRLLEVVRGKHTAPDAIATGIAFGKRLGKLPVVTGNAFGFIGNRIYNAYRRQCEFMLEEGAYPEHVDQALQSFGFAMGPFAVADMSGLDIAWRMRQAQAETRDPGGRYVDIADRLCEMGRLGRKTAAGYYRYDPAQKAGLPDPAVHEVICAASQRKGIKRRAPDDQEIQRRALLAMVNEAALLLAEGVASQPSDIDVVLVNGYGFPRWEGGPVYWARQLGRQQLEKDVDWLAERSGPGFVRGDLSFLF
jgi:3-hydroxyacyl-CoA dehydrogenase